MRLSEWIEVRAEIPAADGMARCVVEYYNYSGKYIAFLELLRKNGEWERSLAYPIQYRETFKGAHKAAAALFKKRDAFNAGFAL